MKNVLFLLFFLLGCGEANTCITDLGSDEDCKTTTVTDWVACGNNLSKEVDVFKKVTSSTGTSLLKNGEVIASTYKGSQQKEIDDLLYMPTIKYDTYDWCQVGRYVKSNNKF